MAAALRRRFDEQAVLQRTGCPLRTSYLPALLAWLAAADARLFHSVRRWAGAGEWLCGELLGQSAISYSAASWTGLLDRRRLAWDDELLAALELEPQQLGTLIDVDVPVGTLRQPWVERWPALARVPWFAAVGDGAAANVGSGCIGRERIALSVGTTGALRVVTAGLPEVPRGLWCYRVDGHSPLLGGATSEGGSVLDWARRTLQISTDALDSYLLDPRGDDHDLVVLPFIAGERSPGWSGDSHMLLDGITLSTTPLDLARASLEAVAYRWAAIAGLLRTAVPEAAMAVASGGGLKYVPRWAQVIADALYLPVAISDETETTSRGVALLTLRTLGLLPDISAPGARLGQRYEPDAARHARHVEAMQRQQALYEREIGDRG
jgi:gluconokinase